MKKCEHFKDLILTDYIDRQLNKDVTIELENHLLDCSDCRVFLNEVKKEAVGPFQQSLRQPVPDGLWGAICQDINEKNRTRPFFQDFIERVKAAFVFPRMVPIFASLVLMFFAGSVTLNNMQLQQAKEKDQGEYLVSLLAPSDLSTASDSSDLGTPIEHYFL